MASIIPGYEYDIFISYRQKDNKGDKWVSQFVDALKTELEATFKETVSVYFDENPHDRLQETHHVDKSLEGKLRCVIFIPILSQTYCDPGSYAWQFELLPFNKMATEDHFGKEIKLRGGNYASRILPIRIHDLEPEDIELFQQETGSVLRAMDFVFKTASGVNRPLRAYEDHSGDNLNKTFYRDQVNKVAHAIKEIILGMKPGAQPAVKEEAVQKIHVERVMEKFNLARKAKSGMTSLQKILSGFFILVALILAGLYAYPKLFKGDRMEMLRKQGQVSVAVMPFQNLTNDSEKNFWQLMIQDNLINFLSNSQDLKIRQRESVLNVLQNNDLGSYASITPSLARQVSRKLDADVFISGSIKQIGQIIRLDANLVDAETEEVFKSFQLDGKAEEILLLTDSLTIMARDFLIVTILKKDLSALDKFYMIHSREIGLTKSPEAFKYYFEGLKNYRKGDWPNTLKLVHQAIEIDPHFPAANLILPRIYGNFGQFEGAKKLAHIQIQNKDNLSRFEKLWAEYNYATYFQTPADGIRCLRQMLELDNQLPILYNDLGYNFCLLGQYDKAIPELEKALEIYKKWGVKPEWAPNYINLGYAYHKTGQYKKEERLYRQAEKDFPGNPSIIRRQAILALARGKTKQANEYLIKYESIIRNEGEPEALIQTRLALIYKEAEIPDVAEKYYREALSLEPENPVRINNLAFFLIDSERDVDQGMELIEKALELRPDNFISLYTKGLGLYKQGKYREALEILQKSWDLRRELAVYNHEAYLHLEEAKKAVANL